MAQNVYIVDYDKLIKLSLPTFLRGDIIYAWLKALLQPVKELYNAFVIYKDDAVYRVSHNGSVTLLQKVLNDKFDNSERRIYIKNVEQTDALRFFTAAASKEQPFNSNTRGAYIGFRSGIGFDPNAADFVVHIPIEYQSADPTELEKFLIKVGSQLDYYKLFAKKYRIEWIS